MDLKYLSNEIKIFNTNYNTANCQTLSDLKKTGKSSFSLEQRKNYSSRDKIKLLLKENKIKSSLLHKNIVNFNNKQNFNDNNKNITCIKNKCSRFLNGKDLNKNQRCLSSGFKNNTQNIKFINQQLNLLYNNHHQLSEKITNYNFLPKSDTENNINDVTHFRTKMYNTLNDFCKKSNNNFRKNSNNNGFRASEICELDLSDLKKSKNTITNTLNNEKQNENEKLKFDGMVVRYKTKAKKFNTRIIKIDKNELNKLFPKNNIVRRKNKSRTTIRNKPISKLRISSKMDLRNYNNILEKTKPIKIEYQKKKSFNKVMKTFLYKEMRKNEIQDLKIKTIRNLEKCDISKFTKSEMQKVHIKYLNLDKKESIAKNKIIIRFNNKLFYKYGLGRLKLENKINNNVKTIFKKIEEENNKKQIDYKRFFIRKGINSFKYINYFSLPQKEIEYFFYKSVMNNMYLNTLSLQTILNDNSYQMVSNYCHNLYINNVYHNHLHSFSSVLKNSSIDCYKTFNYSEKTNQKNFLDFKYVRDFSIYYALKYQLLDNFLTVFSNNNLIIDNLFQYKPKSKNKINEQKNKKTFNNDIKKKNHYFIQDKTDKSETFNFTKKCLEMVVKVNKIKDPEIQELLVNTKNSENTEKLPKFPKFNFSRRLIDLYTEENLIEKKKKNFNTHVIDEYGKKITRTYLNELNPNLGEITLLKNRKYNRFLINHIIDKNFGELLYKIEKYYKFIDLNYKNEDGNTLLHLCVINQIPANIIDFIIQKGINVNCQNNNLDTPLHIACRNKLYPYIDILIKYGASEYILNSENKTCWEC